MKRNLIKVLKIMLILILAISLGYIWYSRREYQSGMDSYAQARQLLRNQNAPIAQNEESPALDGQHPLYTYTDSYMMELAQADIAALREINNDVRGWISIPDTVLDYPLLQAADNNLYLNQTWDKIHSSIGGIFLDAANKRDMGDWHSIIYGHRMRNGSMFALLRLYRDDNYWREHPYVYIATEEAVFCYEIFAAYEASALLADGAYDIEFDTDADKQRYLDDCLAQSLITTQATPTIEQSILTLSTCTARGYSHRWVVQAVLIGVYENGAKP